VSHAVRSLSKSVAAPDDDDDFPLKIGVSNVFADVFAIR